MFRSPKKSKQQAQAQAQFQAQVGSSNSEQQRKLVTDKIIADCYSKVIHEGDRKLNEVSYITHIGIIEYSHSPSAPPPPNSNPGSIKHRKFQSDKNYYQIGRTWDLSELQTIKKVGLDGLILQLNKTYYWKCDEDERRVWKFARYLCQHYGMFTGRYPRLEGFNLDDFMLPATPKSPSTTPSRSSSVKEPTADPQLMKSRSLKRKNMPNPILPRLLLVTIEPRAKEDLNEELQAPPPRSAQHPYYQKSPMYGLDTASEISNDSHSFIFNNKEDTSHEKSEDTSKHDQHKFTGDVLNRFPKRRRRSKKESYLCAAPIHMPTTTSRRTHCIRKRQQQKKALEQAQESMATRQQQPQQLQPDVETTQDVTGSFMDKSSKYEIRLADLILTRREDLNDDLNADVPLAKKPVKNNDTLQASEDFDDDGDSFEPGLNIHGHYPDCDRDAEVDNILDEISWSVQDDADILIKKLNKEATNTKQDIVSKLVSIDLTNNSGSDIGSALSEVDNMTNIFQKMEVKLKLLHNDLQSSVYV
ncbi:hypothetical protein Cantr_05699 [Candida viswanathii]|uniref:Exocyst complex component Sec3 PIP2-binding N-terminal domain-containing protein n=1 Tax=Candida viswanathii TaxID=5486 RepID=A0A367XRD3_9ASCO|nr:hypothetical protein Cantr_05699 [Candida viswanathii]